MSFDDLAADIADEFESFADAPTSPYELRGWSVVRLSKERRPGKTAAELNAWVRERRAADLVFAERRRSSAYRWWNANRRDVNAKRRAKYAADATFRAASIARAMRWHLKNSEQKRGAL